MRIIESRLRRIIRSVIAESIDDMSGELDRMGSRPEGYVGIGGGPSDDLNNRYLVAIADVCMKMESQDIDRMCKKIIECDMQQGTDMQFYCDELRKALEQGNKIGIRECLYYICKNSECCKIVLKCCA